MELDPYREWSLRARGIAPFMKDAHRDTSQLWNSIMFRYYVSLYAPSQQRKKKQPKNPRLCQQETAFTRKPSVTWFDREVVSFNMCHFIPAQTLKQAVDNEGLSLRHPGPPAEKVSWTPPKTYYPKTPLSGDVWMSIGYKDPLVK